MLADNLSVETDRADGTLSGSKSASANSQLLWMDGLMESSDFTNRPFWLLCRYGSFWVNKFITE